MCQSLLSESSGVALGTSPGVPRNPPLEVVLQKRTVLPPFAREYKPWSCNNKTGTCH